MTGERRDACQGKKRFASYKSVNKVARGRHRDGKAQAVYRCQHCGGWHIGNDNHKPPARRPTWED